MNYSLETCNEASVGGRGAEWWAGENSCSLPPKGPPPPHFAFSHLYFSYTPFHLVHAPPSCFLLCTYPFSGSLFLQHSPILITDARRSTCSLLCVAVSFYYWVKWQIHIWSTSPFDDSSAYMLICVAIWVYLVKFAIFYLVSVCVLWDVEFIKEGPLKSLCESSEKPGTSTILPICSLTRTNISPANQAF